MHGHQKARAWRYDSPMNVKQLGGINPNALVPIITPESLHKTDTPQIPISANRTGAKQKQVTEELI
jgi:hypothetical protein